MKIKQIRNATLRINFGEADFLIDPWLIICAIVFYNVPFIALGIAVYKNPENKGLIGLWVFQMVTAYLGVLITAPTSSGL